MTKNSKKNNKKNPVIVGNPERVNNFSPFCLSKVTNGKPDNQDPQSQEENKLEKCKEITPERSGFSVKKCHS